MLLGVDPFKTLRISSESSEVQWVSRVEPDGCSCERDEKMEAPEEIPIVEVASSSSGNSIL